MSLVAVGKTHGHPLNCTCADCDRKYFLVRQATQLSDAMLDAKEAGDDVTAEELCSELEAVNAEVSQL